MAGEPNNEVLGSPPGGSQRHSSRRPAGAARCSSSVPQQSALGLEGMGMQMQDSCVVQVGG